MPILPQQETIVQYITNSAQLTYTFAFYAPFPTDIQVFYQAANATPIPATDMLALNSQYTVTYNADPTTGGFITLLFTPTTGYYLTINRQVQASLNTNFANTQNFNGANLDAALDRLLLLCQQNQNYNLQRNLSYVINTYLPNATPYTQLPPLAQNQVWIGSGAGVTAATIAQVPSASVLQSLLASVTPSADGASIVGYYNPVTSTPTTVAAQLTAIANSINAIGRVGSVGVNSAFAIPIAHNTPTDLVSLTLTPGVWYIYGNIYYIISGGGSINVADAWTSINSATMPDVSNINRIYSAGALGAIGISAPFLSITVPSGTQAIHLTGLVSIISGTVTMCGNIYAVFGRDV